MSSYQSAEKGSTCLVLYDFLCLATLNQFGVCRIAQVEYQGQTRVLDSKPYVTTVTTYNSIGHRLELTSFS